ncbi:MAG: outer membrane lipoprotein LolB [Gammaproteobacteria bacterium]|nr:outer membrane lipoprotein LolB [Gammaproteobacteria bacterium]
MRTIILIFAALVVTACATVGQRPPVADPQGTWQQRQERLRHLDRWDVKGKLGMRGEKKRGQANMVWVRQGGKHSIRLFGPFGGGMVRLTQEPGLARLHDSKKKVYTSDNVHDLLYETTGWEIPFESLQYWVLGLPAPGVPNQLVLDPWGRLANLEQGGWKVQVLSYRRYGDYELPRKLQLVALPGSRPEAPEHEAQVKLVIKRWGL